MFLHYEYLYHHSNDGDNVQDAALNLRTILLCTHLKVTYFLLYPLLPSNTNVDGGLNMELFSFIAVKVFWRNYIYKRFEKICFGQPTSSYCSTTKVIMKIALFNRLKVFEGRMHERMNNQKNKYFFSVDHW